jgi:signal peptidase I
MDVQNRDETTRETLPGWKPVPWIAALLGLFISPLGMLYVQRPWLALGYLTVSVAIAVSAFFALWPTGFREVDTVLGISSWLVSILCAVHAYRIARNMAAGSQRAWYSRWYGLAVWPLTLACVTFLIRAFGYEPFRIPSESMHPTVPSGSLVVVEKLGFGDYGTYGIRLWKGEMTKTIEHGDMIVHRLTIDPRTLYLSRVVGVPGDRVRYLNRQLQVNGVQIRTELREARGRYQYAIERFENVEATVAYMADRPSKDFDAVLTDGEYAMFGDNRDNARDSRYIGAVPEQNIVGRVVKVLKPRATDGEER